MAALHSLLTQCPQNVFIACNMRSADCLCLLPVKQCRHSWLHPDVGIIGTCTHIDWVLYTGRANATGCRRRHAGRAAALAAGKPGLSGSPLVFLSVAVPSSAFWGIALPCKPAPERQPLCPVAAAAMAGPRSAMSINALPDDVLQHVFSKLSFTERCV